MSAKVVVLWGQSVMWAPLVHLPAAETSAGLLIFAVPEHTPCRGLRQATIARLYPFQYTSRFPSI
jgi:hypothetical protein